MLSNLDPIDCQNLLGFLNQKNVYRSLNISKWMKLERLDFDELFATPDQDLSLTRKSVLFHMIMVVTSYFCVGTEIRFLKADKDELYLKSDEDKLWHGRALELATLFFPSDCPIVGHVTASYQRHHAPSLDEIPENSE